MRYVSAAVDALRDRAPGRLDLSRVVALGYSAGDHFEPITVGTPAWELCVGALRRLS